MLVTCPRCFATYNVPESALSGTGRKVRCSACHFEWNEAVPPRDAIAGFAPAQQPEPAPVVTVAPPPADFASLVSAPAPEAAKTPVRRGRSREGKSGAGLSAAAAWSFFVIATIACALVLLREQIGHKATWLADLYEMVGLPVETPADWFRFDGVALEKVEEGGQTVLVVRGKVINQSRKARAVPQLRLFWRQKSGESGPETWLQARPAHLGVGDAARFNGELRGVDASRGGEVKILFVTDKDRNPAGAVAASEAAHDQAPAKTGTPAAGVAHVTAHGEFVPKTPEPEPHQPASHEPDHHEPVRHEKAALPVEPAPAAVTEPVVPADSVPARAPEAPHEAPEHSSGH